MIDNMQTGNVKTGEVVEDALSKCIETGRLSCLDSSYDDVKVIKLHQNQKKHFIIKRNLRKDIAGHWLLLARCIGTCQMLCEGKNRYIGVANHTKAAEY